PRLQTSLLHDVSTTDPTVVGVSPESAPNLTPEQQSVLSIDIQPGTMVDVHGDPIANGKVGISTVPPELVKDMLPAGIMQHTFDLPIQAPGLSFFPSPAALTFPNIFHAAPGTKLNFLSFDHTTGRLVIDGTATVSADGLSATTDPGEGVTHPGWHGLAPPGSPTSPNNQCQPPGTPQIPLPPVPLVFGLHDYLFTSSGQKGLISFGNAATPNLGCPF